MIYECAKKGDIETLRKLYDEDVAEELVKITNKFPTSEFLEQAFSFIKPEYGPKTVKYLLSTMLTSGMLNSGDDTCMIKASQIADIITLNPELLKKIEKGDHKILDILRKLTLRDYLTANTLKDFLYCMERDLNQDELTHIYGMIEKTYTVARLKGLDIQLANEYISEYLRSIYASQSPETEIWNNSILYRIKNGKEEIALGR